MGLFKLFTGPRLDVGAPSPKNAITDTEFLAVDFETTGTDASKHQIVSMGWVPVKGDRIDLARAEYYLIKGVEVGESATIHLLTDEALEEGVELPVALEALLKALEGKALLAHFAALETGFINAACAKLKGAQPDLTVVDTFVMERRHMERMGTYPRGEDLRLPRVRGRYGLPAYSNHNALTDALACAEVFLAITAQSKARKIKDLQG